MTPKVNGTTTDIKGFPLGVEDINGRCLEFQTPIEDGLRIELFGGAGGLTLGLAAAELSPDHILELDANCCETLRLNSEEPSPHITANLHQADIAEFDWTQFNPRPVRLLAAGPPCQPFSRAGKHLADRDGRNQFPAIMRAIRILAPSVVLVENVPGILRSMFAQYFAYIVRQLRYPSVGPMPTETWNQHDERVRRHEETNDPDYHVAHWILNAADYGVAQSRVRVFLVASRASMNADLRAPLPTHSRAALRYAQETGAYWHNHAMPARTRDCWPLRAHSPTEVQLCGCQPWKTVREALKGLPEPPLADIGNNSHWFIPGARTYRGHTGSELDWPAKTIKAGVHGVAGGENVLQLPDGTHRYFTLREMARLQDFPDDYGFTGPRSRVVGQIGNAVPRALGRAIGHQLGLILHNGTRDLVEGRGQAIVSTEFGAARVSS